jgi:hypothetical protein
MHYKAAQRDEGELYIFLQKDNALTLSSHVTTAFSRLQRNKSGLCEGRHDVCFSNLFPEFPTGGATTPAGHAAKVPQAAVSGRNARCLLHDNAQL